jgi:hypothetical protein
MKDGHDKRTLELIAPAPQDALYVAQQRARLLMETFLPVSMVAKDWKVSARRIRALLLSGRLKGRQQANGYWEVAYPYSYTFGTHGPALRCTHKAITPSQKPELRVV